VRKCLGVLAVCAAFYVTSWAQDQAPNTPPVAPPTGTAQPPAATQPAPTPAPSTDQSTAAQPIKTPPPVQKVTPVAAAQYPRFELFGGGTYAEAGFFNAGHWAGLEGWDASLAFNATHLIGLVVDGGQYFGTSKIPVAVPTPFPTCPPLCPTTFPTFDVTTRSYDILFGLQFSRRKSERWTPFGEILFGHAGVRGQAVAQGFGYNAVSSGLAVVAGGGADYKITQRFSMRLKADYLETKAFKQKQDNFRFSVGVVIHSVRKKKRTLEEDVQPE
jgi:hypothetical protein